MDAKIASKYLLRKFLDDFEIDPETPNAQFLENQLQRVERMAIDNRTTSRDPKVKARNRARARDLEQNCYGIINGIKFALSFIENKHKDLAKES